MTRVALLCVVLSVMPCAKYDLEWAISRPEYVRIPGFTKEEMIETDEREFVIQVQKGDCLSSIVEECLNEYVGERAREGMVRYGQTLYAIVDSIKTESGRTNLIYPGEIVSFRLPKVISVLSFDYYRERKQIFGLDNLKKLLDFQWLIPYTKGVFNCSERTGFVEYYLESKGFNTDIVENEKHAWCIVEVQRGEWVNVECVSSPPAIGKAPDAYMIRYENIWEAIEVEPGEYDWWKRVDGKAVIGRRF